MTALPSSGSFAMVDPSHVAEVGPAAAILYARVLWRTQAGGGWRASRATLSQETGLSDDMIRGALRVLREQQWLTGERASTQDATMVWRPVFAGHVDMGKSPTSSGENPQIDQGKSTMSSIETDKTTTLPRTLRVVGTEDQQEPATQAAPERPELQALCDRLADRIEANGSRRPTVTQAWLRDCRLLIDKDGRTPAQVATAIDWCQAHDFWKANVLSMPTLRKQYDRLRLIAQRERGTVTAAAPETWAPPRTDPFAPR